MEESLKYLNKMVNLQKKGYNVYCNFCSLIYDLNMIVDGMDSELIEKLLDQIVNE